MNKELKLTLAFPLTNRSYNLTKGMQGIALLIILGGLCSAVSSIRIGAFNIQDFGQKKLQNTIKYGSKTMPVKEVLFKILNRYDVVLIQEISMDDNTFNSFVTDFNKYFKTKNAK